MEKISKQDRAQLIALVKKGNLARCTEWLKEMRELVNKPLEEKKENSFDRCMEITKAARDFYKEANYNEDYYRNTLMIDGVANHLRDGYITYDDLSELSEEVKDKVKLISGIDK